jgi:adenosine deaminase
MFVMTTETTEAKPRTKKKAVKTVSNLKPERRKKEAEKDLGKTYNEFKEFEGRQYTGMRVGRSHKWYYDQGEWKETKITP